jgi:hypothetical protein
MVFTQARGTLINTTIKLTRKTSFADPKIYLEAYKLPEVFSELSPLNNIITVGDRSKKLIRKKRLNLNILLFIK